MEPRFQSSFIPKGPIQASGPASAYAPVHQRTIIGMFAVALFVLAIVAALGVFGYDEYLLHHIGTLGADLNAAQSALEPDTVNKISAADLRLSSSKALINRHVAISPLLGYLESSTLKNIQLTHFTYTAGDKGDTLTLDGVAASYADLKLESDALASAAFLKNQTLSNFSLDDKGNVSFSFSADVDPAYVLYRTTPAASVDAPVVAASSTVALASSTPAVASTTLKSASTTSKSSSASSTAR